MTISAADPLSVVAAAVPAVDTAAAAAMPAMAEIRTVFFMKVPRVRAPLERAAIVFFSVGAALRSIRYARSLM
ncbi:hypothetical protein MANY_17650 [Mycolicibacterium anyangense]|uniref:Uncharacterized protein n=1 Tax=Mycolicibacterium anyangense TaxID=1431246 RepID=A0A6N4W7D2_9MYCO|nr:hypothetical protein MANY_17650 [Mycolicibacterium anyangense]